MFSSRERTSKDLKLKEPGIIFLTDLEYKYPRVFGREQNANFFGFDTSFPLRSLPCVALNGEKCAGA